MIDSTQVNTIIENAIAWAKEQMDSHEYDGWCLSFIEDAVERSNSIEIFGGDSANESACLYQAANNTGTPSKGSFVFYRCNGIANGEKVDWGHCGLCIGDGKVIHAYNGVRIDSYLEIESLEPPENWTQNQYIGYAPIEAVLSYRE